MLVRKWTFKGPFSDKHPFRGSLRNPFSNSIEIYQNILISWDENLYESFYEPEKHENQG